MHMGLCVGMCRCPWNPEGTGLPVAGVTVASCPCGSWELNSGSL